MYNINLFNARWFSHHFLNHIPIVSLAKLNNLYDCFNLLMGRYVMCRYFGKRYCPIKVRGFCSQQKL